MDDRAQFRRLAGYSALLAGVLAVVSTVLGVAAVGADLGLLAAPERILNIGARGARLLRWSMLCDVFGYYLLLAPVALYLQAWLKDRSPHGITLYTFGGLAWVLLGATGAAVLAAVLPPLIRLAAEQPAARATAATVAVSVVNAVYLGVWNPLEVVLGGMWWLGIGSLLRKEQRGLGALTIILGAAAWLDAFGLIFSVDLLFLAGLAGVLALVPVWSFWLALILLKPGTD